MELPEPAIRWLAINASSNTELATLSNVCKKWREIVGEAILEQAKNSINDDSRKLLLLPSIVRCLMLQDMDDKQDVETFCLSWFHPNGILSKHLPLDPMNDSDDEDDLAYMRGNRGGSPDHFAPSGHESYVGSEEEKNASRRQNTRSPTPLMASGPRRNEKHRDDYVCCMYQWNSFRDAKDILCPFGYTPFFIQFMIYQARSKSSGDMKLLSPTKGTISQEYRTYAVRGATFARPEGYCLCWDKDLPNIEDQMSKVSVDPQTYHKQHELNRLARRRSRRRREVQREVLPRVVNSTPYKVSEDQSAAGVLPAIQFLNVDFSHAVRLFTPPFKPGPVSTPITFFCVAIATEDGCFLSGLRQRFEFGHLYPESAKDSLIERSPICICTNFGQEPPTEMGGGQSGEGLKKNDSSYNSDDSSCDVSAGGVSSDPPTKCSCPLSGLGQGTDESDDEYGAHVCRGKRGPGTWHCYTVVVDGKSSVIRIDGISEPLQCSSSIEENTSAYLDGLTIGADHTFDMSLCFGQGSDGEGEGAISELALFKGRLDMADIETIESHLMTKHGIPLPIQSESDIYAEDGFSRLAHAMLSHAPHHKVFANGKQSVPLRYMAKHRIVAWRQVNPVTGEAIRVSRIGTKTHDSSSEW